jgi:hypothetical protein
VKLQSSPRCVVRSHISRPDSESKVKSKSRASRAIAHTHLAGPGFLATFVEASRDSSDLYLEQVARRLAEIGIEEGYVAIGAAMLKRAVLDCETTTVKRYGS